MTDLVDTELQAPPTDLRAPHVGLPERASPAFKRGLIALGLLIGLGKALTQLAQRSDLLLILAALCEVLAYGLVFGGLAALIDPLLTLTSWLMTRRSRRVENSVLREERLLEILARIAEQRPAFAPPPAPMTQAGPRTQPSPPTPQVELDEVVRRAIREGHWQEASSRLQAFASEAPDDPRVASLSAELEQAKGSIVESIRAKVAAARGVNDSDRVFELHDEIAGLLDHEAKDTWDKDLVRWFMIVIQKRLRSGTVGPDVATIAAKVAERFDTTSEGASLRAALPTLRRSAGLCARCGEPYKGLADACPKCLGAAYVEPEINIEPVEEEEESETYREFPFGEI